MGLEELANINLDEIGIKIRKNIMNKEKLSNNQLEKLEIITDIGSGAFGITKKIKANENINNNINNNKIIIPKDTKVLGKYIKVNNITPALTEFIVAS